MSDKRHDPWEEPSDHWPTFFIVAAIIDLVATVLIHNAFVHDNKGAGSGVLFWLALFLATIGTAVTFPVWWGIIVRPLGNLVERFLDRRQDGPKTPPGR